MSQGWDGRVPVCEGKLDPPAVGGGVFGFTSVTGNTLVFSDRLRRASESGERRAERLPGGVVHLPERGPLPVSRRDPDGAKRGLVHAGRDMEHSSHL